MQFEPVVVTGSHEVPPLPAAHPEPRPVRRVHSGPFLARVASDRSLLLCMVDLQYGNPADSLVCAYIL